MNYVNSGHQTIVINNQAFKILQLNSVHVHDIIYKVKESVFHLSL